MVKNGRIEKKTQAPICRFANSDNIGHNFYYFRWRLAQVKDKQKKRGLYQKSVQAPKNS